MPDTHPTLRRSWLAVFLVASACTSATAITGINGPIPPSSLTTRQTAFLDALERRTFNWLWEKSGANNGLTLERSYNRASIVRLPYRSIPAGRDDVWTRY